MQILINNTLIFTLFFSNLIPTIQLQEVQTPTKLTSNQESDLAYDQYCNARFGYCIDYPTGVILPQPESGNGDGRIFTNKKGEEILRVFGRNNIDPDGGQISIQQQYKEDVNQIKAKNATGENIITYQKLGKTFFVISGYKKGKIFYQKTIMKDDTFAYAMLQYDKSDKAIFDKVSERIFKSFK
jgi:hypothetical protein